VPVDRGNLPAKAADRKENPARVACRIFAGTAARRLQSEHKQRRGKQASEIEASRPSKAIWPSFYAQGMPPTLKHDKADRPAFPQKS
jgi:hypothetical protein